MGRKFGVLYDPDDLQRVKCRLCGKEISIRISRLKQHVGQVKRQVKSCMVVKQHKVVEEQLHLAATKCTALKLKELLQRVALDIALEASVGQYGSKSSIQNS